MQKLIRLFFILILASTWTLSWSDSTEESISVIPTPQYCRRLDGSFLLDGSVEIISNLADPFYSTLISEHVSQSFGIFLNSRQQSGNVISLTVIDEAALQKVADQNDWDLPFSLGDEGYILNIQLDSVQIIAHQPAGVFYGIQSLLQLIPPGKKDLMLPCLLIIDKPDLAFRGWQDDISRGPIPSTDFLKEQIRRMSAFKLNKFTLYTEHVFKSEKHPSIAPADGITKAQIRELSVYARKYHIELMANYQAFGHMTSTLDKDPYIKLAETPHLISPAFEDTYSFLEDMITEIADAYQGSYFHLNCDETFGLGEGPAKNKLDSLGANGLYAFHINRLSKIVKQKGMKPIIWSDVAEEHPELFKMLDDDLLLMPWDYDAKDNFTAKLSPYAERNYSFIVAPAVTCWNAIIPDFDTSFKNIYTMVRDGQQAGTKGVMITTWDDGGLNFFHPNWYGLAWGGAVAWNVPDEETGIKDQLGLLKERFDRGYQTYAFNGINIISLINRFSSFHSREWRSVVGLDEFLKPVFPLYPLKDMDGKRNELLSAKKHVDDLIDELDAVQQSADSGMDDLKYLAFSLDQSRFIVEKNLFKLQLRSFLDNREGSLESINSNRKSLAQTLIKFKGDYIQLWQMENREWWLDKNLARFDYLINELQHMDGLCFIEPLSYERKGKMSVRILEPFGQLPIYYTTDGSNPDLHSTIYTQPFLVESGIIKTRSTHNNIEYPMATDSFIAHKAIGKLHQLYSQYSLKDPRYSAGGEMALLDGRKGSARNFQDGRWQGFSSEDLDITIDLGKRTKMQRVSIDFLQKSIKRVILPEYVEFYHSENGVDFTLLQRFVHSESPLTNAYLTKSFEYKGKLKTRFLKVFAKSLGVLPEGHRKKGRAVILMADEILVY